MSFQQLLEDLELLSKAHTVDDEGAEDDAAIAAAAEEGAGEGATEEADGEDPGAGEGEDLLGKSFTVVLENGEEAEGVDADALIKSLQDVGLQVVQLKSDRNEDNASLTKALGSMTELLKAQGDALTALTDRVDALANSGSGRRSQVAADPTMVKSQQEESKPLSGLSGRELLTKCDEGFKTGRITGLELSTAEAYVNRNQAIPQYIVNKLDKGV